VLNKCSKPYGAKGLDLRAGVWEGLVNDFHIANAPLLICSFVTILSKLCNKQTCLNLNDATLSFWGNPPNMHIKVAIAENPSVVNMSAKRTPANLQSRNYLE